jgi:hypothetical protein
VPPAAAQRSNIEDFIYAPRDGCQLAGRGAGRGQLTLLNDGSDQLQALKGLARWHGIAQQEPGQANPGDGEHSANHQDVSQPKACPKRGKHQIVSL